jgi:hypothetical protein
MKITPFWIFLAIAIGIPLLTVNALSGGGEGAAWLALLLLPVVFCIVVPAFVVFALFSANSGSWFLRAVRVLVVAFFGLGAFGTSLSCTYYAVTQAEYARFLLPIGIFMGFVAALAIATVTRDVRQIWSLDEA